MNLLKQELLLPSCKFFLLFKYYNPDIRILENSNGSMAEKELKKWIPIT